ncbi:hypothetical protein AYI69_g6984 [Smittium culicis]|uniref:Uncharacterized protein n=1 Tax=Smittium culicis TaxID=133412 RepID=A0A1R1XV72_9FUNG|nr:hypothetical protein AYI69_g6984 [Smittium culicis]
MEALPSIEVDFFRSPLSDEEKRDIVQSSPRTVDMVYTPPPINDYATAPIKKLDTAYYNDEPEAPTNDPRFLFTSTMRLLLSEACTLLTQARLDNLNSGLNLPGRPPQLNPSSNEPLIDPAVLSELMATKKLTNSGGKKPFRGRQQQTASQAAPKTVTIAAMAQVVVSTNFKKPGGGLQAIFGCKKQSSTGTRTIRQTLATDPESQVEHETHGAQISQGHDVGDCGSAVEKGNQEGIPAVSWILLEYIHGSKEIRGTSSFSGNEAKEVDQEIFALTMELESIPVPGPTIWDFPITADFYQNPPSSPTRLQNQRIKIIVSAHSVHSAPRYEDQHKVHDASGTRKQGPHTPENSKRNDKSRNGYNQSHCVICWQGPSDDSGDSPGAPEAPQTYGFEDQLLRDNLKWTSTVIIMEPALENLTWRRDQLFQWNGNCFLPEISEQEIFTDSSDTGWGVVAGSQTYSASWPDHIMKLHINAKELLKILYAVRLPSVVGRSGLVYPDNTTTLAYVRKDTPTGHLHPVSNEPGRCAIENDCPDRMVDFPYRLQGNPGPVRKQRHRSNRFSKKHATGEILQLVSRQGSRGSRRLHAAMVSMEERLLLPTVELDPSMAIGNVVPRPNEVGNPPTNILTGNSGGSRQQKRQFAFDE